MNQYFKLQNGSDVRGVALEGVPGEPITLTTDIARVIGFAFAHWLSNRNANTDGEQTNLKIGVGHDSRLSAEAIKTAVAQGLEKQNCAVFDCGLASTPAMFMSTVFDNHGYDGAIMLTASHLPANRNGMKFFTREGGLNKEDIRDILTIATEINSIDPAPLNNTSTVSLMDDYANHLVNIIRTGAGSDAPLSGLNIIVDAGNGAGGFFVEQVLKPLGANTTGSQFLEPDGNFPNHPPNPENKDAMNAIISAVQENKADFGIIFDTDVDRAGAVDKNGKPINRNRFIALMAAIVLEEHPGSCIVTDSVTSSGLKWWIEDKLGGTHHRFKRGYKNVINEAIRLNEAGTATQLALETSGHGALKENYFLDDGAYQIAKILIKIATLKANNLGTIDELIAELPEPAEATEFRMNINTEDFGTYGDAVLQAFESFVKAEAGWTLTPNNFEGIHVTTEHGWILMRKSLHDPQLPINIESNLAGDVATLTEKVRNFLKSFDALG